MNEIKLTADGKEDYAKDQEYSEEQDALDVVLYIID